MKDQLVGPFLVTIATAIVTVLAAWLQEIVRNRSRENTRQRGISQIKDEIAAIEAWSNARIALASDLEKDDVRGKASHDLDKAYGRLRALLTEGKELESDEWSAALRGAISRLLLRHIPAPGRVKFVRYIYYASLFGLLFWIGIWISEQKSWTDLTEIAASVFAYFVFAIIPTSFLAWLTIRLSRRRLGPRVTGTGIGTSTSSPDSLPPQATPDPRPGS